MNRVSILSAIVLMLISTGICQADSLVITYRSGKTQTVVLDEPSQGINSWQFVSGAAPQQQSIRAEDTPTSAKQEPLQEPQVSQPKNEIKATDKVQDKKSGVRVKWNAKPIPD